MTTLYAQGDILIEKVAEREHRNPAFAQNDALLSVVVAHGEASGHSHRLWGAVCMYRDDALARDIPAGLYISHVAVGKDGAKLLHEEHGPIALEPGFYRMRRQRQLEPTDVGILEESSARED